MNSNEPQIINYYNDFPEYAIIINNLNEEYDELITNYIRLYDKVNQYEKKPIIKIARLAGQFAKPRTSKKEIKNNQTLPSYMGDAVNGLKFNALSRAPNPNRLLKAYNQSAGTLNLLRSLTPRSEYFATFFTKLSASL